jgi:hypothetical protein
MKQRCECGRQLWDMPCPRPWHDEFAGGHKLVMLECISLFDYTRREYKRAYWEENGRVHFVWLPVDG